MDAYSGIISDYSMPAGSSFTTLCFKQRNNPEKDTFVGMGEGGLLLAKEAQILGIPCVLHSADAPKAERAARSPTVPLMRHALESTPVKTKRNPAETLIALAEQIIEKEKNPPHAWVGKITRPDADPTARTPS